jgi:hypothetical protein
MQLRSLASAVLVAALTFTAMPAFAQDDSGAKPRGAVLGTVIGLAAGAAAGTAYIFRSHCRNFDEYYDSVWTYCVAPASLMVAGGGIAGYFLGRSSDRRSRSESRASRLTARENGRITDLVPPIRLRRTPSAIGPQARPYARLFVSAGHGE